MCSTGILLSNCLQQYHTRSLWCTSILSENSPSKQRKDPLSMKSTNNWTVTVECVWCLATRRPPPQATPLFSNIAMHGSDVIWLTARSKQTIIEHLKVSWDIDVCLSPERQQTMLGRHKARYLSWSLNLGQTFTSTMRTIELFGIVWCLFGWQTNNFSWDLSRHPMVNKIRSWRKWTNSGQFGWCPANIWIEMCSSNSIVWITMSSPFDAMLR